MYYVIRGHGEHTTSSKRHEITHFVDAQSLLYVPLSNMLHTPFPITEMREDRDRMGETADDIRA